MHMKSYGSILLAASVLGFCCATPGRAQGPDIREEVQNKLLQLSEYTAFDHLGDTVNGSEVTLTGQVVNPAVKDEATKAVQGIDGVTAVLNEIEVLPSSPSDNAIRAAEYRSIYSDPALQRYGNPLDPTIRIIVKNGEVSLEGVVAGQGDKETTTACAESVPGIVRVNNNLMIEQGVSE